MASPQLSSARPDKGSLRSHPRWRASLRLGVDLCALSLALWIAFVLRFEGDLAHGRVAWIVSTWPWIIGLQYAALSVHRVPRFQWSSIGLRELPSIAFPLTLVAALFLLLRLGATGHVGEAPFSPFVLPISIICLDAVFGMGAVVAVRALWRARVESTELRRHGRADRRRAILIGAGRGGLLLARELSTRPGLGYEPVAFVDDDRALRGKMVHGIPVLGSLDELAAVADRVDANTALITIASAAGRSLTRIVETCAEAGLVPKTVPRVHEILSGRVKISHIRDVAIEDLLGREPVELADSAAPRAVRGKVCVVTGAGGSIGSEICRQILALGPARLILCEQAEPSLYQIHRELTAAYPDIDIVPAIADVCDGRRMHDLFAEHEPAVVFHAAAHKHVPLMELNPGEAIKNNAVGTRTLADLACKFDVDRFVLISTDKAVAPTSVMGATKRLAELYVEQRAKSSRVRFATVRFGNVLGSAGSVIPLFREQIARGGPVTVTHPDMVRYFMTIPEASRLVVEAAGLCRGSDLMVLDMGEPINILSLAERMIRLSGLEPHRDIEVRFTGIRDGEKLFEELHGAGEAEVDKQYGKISIYTPRGSDDDIGAALDEFTRQERTPREARAFLARYVEGYRYQPGTDELVDVELSPVRRSCAATAESVDSDAEPSTDDSTAEVDVAGRIVSR